MTSALTGKAGVVKIGASPWSEVTSWSCETTSEPVDATSMTSAGWMEFVAGLSGASGSFTLLVYRNSTGSQAAATFQVAAAAAANAPVLTGSIHISSEGIACPVDDRVEYAYNYVFSGAVSVATA